MSLILEALRKSEAERRRGHAPDVLADMPPAQPAARRTPPAWLWLLPLVAVVLVALWLLRDRQAPPPEAATPAPTQQTAVDQQQPPEPALPTVQRLTPTPVMPPRPAQPVAKTPPPTRVADAPRATPSVQTPPPTVSEAVAPPPATPLSNTPPAAPTRTPTPVATAQPASKQPDAMDINGTMSLSDLTTTDRQSLPPLKLSMHLWNADPARRFVILDGNRVVEGDRVGDDAVVKDITTDGVVVDWHGRRIKLPIR